MVDASGSAVEDEGTSRITPGSLEHYVLTSIVISVPQLQVGIFTLVLSLELKDIICSKHLVLDENGTAVSSDQPRCAYTKARHLSMRNAHAIDQNESQGCKCL